MGTTLSYPIHKVTNQRPQDSKQERRIPNQVGNPRDELNHNVLQDRIPWDQANAGQMKSELLMRFHRPGILPKGKT